MSGFELRPVDPIAEARLNFIGATLRYAQHPAGGVALVGAEIVGRMLEANSLTERVDLARRFASTPLIDGPLNHVTAATAAIHQLLDLHIPGGDLRRAAAFTYDLVRGGVVSTATEYNAGGMGDILPEIGIVSGNNEEQFVELAKDYQRLEQFGGMLAVSADTMMAVRGDPHKAARRHMTRILAIARYYAPDDPERRLAMGRARTDLSAALEPSLRGALTPHSPYPHAVNPSVNDVIINNILRHAPSTDLLNLHFPERQQATGH